ncbi:MAG: hypothetical protein ASARMPRED_004498 [Alectoria sarmentosa]|nr:MAG: hypothetical protein ASARMPRED_004498 [Alectoria sarmentosa]
MLQTIVIPLAFAIVTFAAVMPIGYCPRPAIIYTTSGPPVLDTSVTSCNSTMTAMCGLGVRASTIAEYTVTIGGGFTLDVVVLIVTPAQELCRHKNIPK